MSFRITHYAKLEIKEARKIAAKMAKELLQGM